MADCPVCLLYDQLAVASALLEDLTGPAMRYGTVPDGLGGTIDQARQRLEEADGLLRQIAAVLPWDLSELATCIEQTRHGIAGTLTPPAIAALAAMAKSCREQAHRLAWSYYLARRAS